MKGYVTFVHFGNMYGCYFFLRRILRKITAPIGMRTSASSFEMPEPVSEFEPKVDASALATAE